MSHLELAIVACCHGIQMQLHQHVLHAVAGIHQTQLQGKQACHNSMQLNATELVKWSVRGNLKPLAV